MDVEGIVAVTANNTAVWTGDTNNNCAANTHDKHFANKLCLSQDCEVVYVRGGYLGLKLWGQQQY